MASFRGIQLIARVSIRHASSNKDPLLETLRAALKDAMRARDSQKSTIIKSVIGDINQAQHLANPPSTASTLNKAIKKRKEAIEQFLASPQGASVQLAESYQAEVDVLSGFVTAQKSTFISSSDLAAKIAAIQAELKIERGDGKALGRLIKECRQRIPEEEAPSKDIASAAKKALES